MHKGLPFLDVSQKIGSCKLVNHISYNRLIPDGKDVQALKSLRYIPACLDYTTEIVFIDTHILTAYSYISCLLLLSKLLRLMTLAKIRS